MADEGYMRTQLCEPERSLQSVGFSFADRVSHAGAAPEDALATPAAPAALPLTSSPTCQRKLQLFCHPQVPASSTRMVLATTRHSMSESRSASRSTASVFIRPYTRIELVAARCTSARCCLLLLTDGLLMTSLASLIDSLIAPLIPLLMASPMASLIASLMDSLMASLMLLSVLIRRPRLSHPAVRQERERELG